jgi:hypothetical protein
MVAEGELAVPSKVSVQAGHIPRGAVVSCFAFLLPSLSFFPSLGCAIWSLLACSTSRFLMFAVVYRSGS